MEFVVYSALIVLAGAGLLALWSKANRLRRAFEESHVELTESKKRREALKEAKEQAEAASAAKSQFLAKMSHEIRTPMHTIIGMTELALDTDLSAEQAEYLTGIRHSAKALLSIINDILDLSKIEAGKFTLDPIAFNLRSCLADSIASLAVETRKRDLTLEWEVDSRVPDALVGDAGRLRQIMVNLIGNALRFTEKGGIWVKVKLQSEDSEGSVLQFSVKDTGIGVPPHKQEEIFQAFCQADGSITRRYGGTGLGLSISSQLVALMGGQIWLESGAGNGSTFYFTARFARGEGTAIPGGKAERSFDLEGLTALIVEDRRADDPSASDLLEQWRIETTVVRDADVAIKVLEEARSCGAPFDLVVCEAKLLDLDGLPLAERIQAVPGLAKAVILITASGQRGDAERCKELGVSAYLARPFDREDLHEAALEALARTRGGDSTLVTRHSVRDRRRRLNVLLAEDNELSKELAVCLLEKWGHAVVVATNGKEAVSEFEKQRFDIVLMDMQMPEMGGIEATRVIRESEKRKEYHTPILGMTANVMKSDTDLCLEAGMDRCLCKPVVPDDLLYAIDDLTRDQGSERHEQKKFAESRQLVVDLETARSSLGKYQEFFPRLVEVALREYPGQLQSLRAAIERGESELVQMIAHSFKSSGAQFGARGIYEHSVALESMGRRNDLTGASENLAELEREVMRFRAFFSRSDWQEMVTSGGADKIA